MVDNAGQASSGSALCMEAATGMAIGERAVGRMLAGEGVEPIGDGGSYVESGVCVAVCTVQSVDVNGQSIDKCTMICRNEQVGFDAIANEQCSVTMRSVSIVGPVVTA